MATLVMAMMTGACLALPVSSIVARDTILVLDGCLGRRSPAAFRRTVSFTTTAPSTASTKSWNRVWSLHVRIAVVMVATPPSTFLNVLGGLGFTFTLLIILLALVLRMVLFTVATTRALVLLPPPRNIGVARRRCRMIIGPHLGHGTSFGFLLNTRLVELNRDKTVMLDQDMANLQIQVEIASIGFQSMGKRFLRLHQRGYGLITGSKLLVVCPNEACRVVNNGFRMRIVTNIGSRFCKHVELVAADQRKQKSRTY